MTTIVVIVDVVAIDLNTTLLIKYIKLVISLSQFNWIKNSISYPLRKYGKILLMSYTSIYIYHDIDTVYDQDLIPFIVHHLLDIFS